MPGQKLNIIIIFFCLLMATPNPAFAYIGPGAGLGAIAVTIALLLGVFLLVMGLVWYPLKRMLKKKKNDEDGCGHFLCLALNYFFVIGWNFVSTKIIM